MALLVLSGCGELEPASHAWIVHTDPGRGYSVSVPESWQRASEPMSRITEPRELLSVGTAPLRWQHTDCEAFAGSAGAGMGTRDVVLTIWERGDDRDREWSDFPPRPSRFGPVAGAETSGPGCGEPAGTMIHWRNFSDSGRRFHSLVRLGRDAPPGAVAQVWEILDRLRLR